MYCTTISDNSVVYYNYYVRPPQLTCNAHTNCRDASDHDIQQEDSDAEDTSGVQVCTCGPPGTEPVLSAGFSSMTRYDKNKSVVYSRVSAGAGLLSGHTPSRVQLLSIPPKDSPHVRGEVYAVIDQSCPRRRHRSR